MFSVLNESSVLLIMVMHLFFSISAQPSTALIMIRVLNDRFQVEGQALAWFLYYLGDRSQIFRFDGRDSLLFPVDCIVPQGYCFRPVEFISYTEDVVELMERHLVHNH